jgi:cytoskeleton protein RodZ
MPDSNEQDGSQETTRPPSPGARLRAAREHKGLTLVEVADALRLDQMVVEALERDDFAALGAPVFAKGHLRKYAALTGEPVEDLLLAYHQHVGVQEVPPLLDRAALLRAAERPPSGVPVGAFVALLIAGGLAGVWWWYEQPVKHPMPIGSTTGALAAVSIEPDPADTASPDPLATPSVAQQGAVAGELESASSETSLQSAGDTVATATDESGTSPTTAIGAGATPALPATTPDARAAEPPTASMLPQAAPRPGDHSLVLSFTGVSWAEVRDARGDRLYYELGVSGSRRSLHGLPPFEITLGSYHDVNVEIDGQVRPIPADAIRGNTARFTLDPT